MSESLLLTPNLQLVPQTREQVRAAIDHLPPEQRKEVSPAWLARLESSATIDPWMHGFRLVHRESGRAVGQCGFKGPPDDDGVVEIAYGIEPEHQGRGYATQAAEALVRYAFNHDRVRLVRAHTLRQPNASTRVLTKCGFRQLGEVLDPEDGPVWRWELPRVTSLQ